MNTQQQPASFNIILADDDTDDCSFFKEALKELTMPTSLTVVHDGEQLMQLLSNETNQLPNAIFLDLNMPRKNGFECLTEIKHNTKLKQIPVIVYSTSFHNKIANMLYEAGAKYYISKPSEIANLKKAVQKMLKLIAAGNFEQPSKEDFLLTDERKNAKAYLWFKEFFVIPASPDLN